jgi:hypothetical protein
MEQVLKEIKDNWFNVTTNEDLTDYLSCEIWFNEEQSKAWIGQPHMVKKIKRTFKEKVKGLRSYKTPGTPGKGVL